MVIARDMICMIEDDVQRNSHRRYFQDISL